MRTLNLGILAHVDAGKTSLTERLLYAAGVIDEIGSVDAGSTQTDSLALERQRGITIKSAVVSFVVDDVTVNLIDTPGHPDFIAEVERVLERARRRRAGGLGRRGRAGADPRADAGAAAAAHPDADLRQQDRPRAARSDERVLQAIAEQADAGDRRRWARCATLGTRGAGVHAVRRGRRRLRGRGWPSVLAEHDDALLAALRRRREPRCPTRGCAARSPRRRGGRCVHPVFFGSAITGAGVDALIAGIAELLPAADGRRRRRRSRAPSSRSSAARRARRSPTCACSRARVRDARPAALRRGTRSGKVTAISVFDRGAAVQRASVAAGQIGKLWGLGDVQIGDAIGAPRARRGRAPLRPADARDGRRRRAARPTAARCTPRSPSSPSRTR